MKKIFNFIPVAVAAISLVSCSSDDFFGLNNQEDKITLTANVEADDVTRASKDASGSNFTWATGDELRIYDSNLQKYDVFEKKADKNFFTLKGTTQFITEQKEGKLDYAYALFGAGAGISYAGWKQDGATGVLTALVNVPAQLNYSEAKASDGTTVTYNVGIPMWGTVTPSVAEYTGEAKSFETSMSKLAGQAKIVFKNGTKMDQLYARASALRFATAADVTAGKKCIDGTTACVAADAAIKTKIKAQLADLENNTFETVVTGGTNKIKEYLVADETKPMNGWYEARLETNGYLQNASDAVVQQPADRNTITAKLVQANMKDYENVVYLPLVPQTYEILAFEYSENALPAYANYNLLRVDFDKEVTRTSNIGKMTKTYSLTYDVDGLESTYEIGRYMAMYNSANGSVELNLEGNFATIDGKLPEMYTIYIPQLNHDMVVTIKKPALGNDFDISSKNLVIADAEGVTNFDKKVTINFEDFKAEATNNIQIKTKRPIEITGDFTDITNGIVAANSSTLTLGTEDNNIKVGTVALAKADGETAVGEVVVNTKDATAITTLANTDGANITVNGGAITTLDVLNFNDTQTITMTGGSIATLTAGNIAAAKVVGKKTVQVATSGEAVLGTTAVTPKNKDANNYLHFAFTSTLNAATLAAAGGLATAQADVYTAAQFYALQEGNVGADIAAVLQTNITIDPAAAWAPMTLDADIVTDIDGNGKTISGLKQPLFGTLKVGVKDLALTNVEIEEYLTGNSEIGALAKKFEVSDDKTIKNVTISGTSIGAKYDENGKAETVCNVGGLFGQVEGMVADKTLTIDNCAVTLTGAIQGRYNLGGFIGNAVSTNKAYTIDFVNTAAVAKRNKSNIAAFKKTFWANLLSDEHCGKVGYFIGGITNGTAAVNVNLGAGGQDFNTYFTAAATTFDTGMAESSQAYLGKLEFARNVVGGKAFLGMTAIPDVNYQYIGYSTVGSGMGTIKVWGGPTHSYGTPATVVNWKDIVNKRAE